MRNLFNAGVLIISFFFFIFADLTALHRIFWTPDFEITVIIKKGDNLSIAGKKLEEAGVIFNKHLFILSGRLLGYQNEIIPGEYKFPNGITTLNVLRTITDADISRIITLTIPEGLNNRQIGKLVSKQLGLDSALFIRETFNDSLIKILNEDVSNLEGFLFPDTYEIDLTKRQGKEKEIVLMMFQRFRQKVNSEVLEKINHTEKSLKEIITLASIIEAETRYHPEKNIIAGVYINRLRKKMKLEADPTVQYSLPNGPKKKLTYSDLKIDSPYNTYLYRGLPPGPINNPGFSSILAALEPAKHNYLYFVAKGDGSHRFAETFEDHKQNIRKYRLFLEENENRNGNGK